MRWTALLLFALLAVSAFAEVVNITVIEEVVVPASAPLVEDALDLFVDNLLNISNSSEEQFIVNSSVSELNASIIDEVSSEVVEVISVVNDSVTASVSLDNSSELVSPASSEIVPVVNVEVVEEVVSPAVAPLADQVLDSFADGLINSSQASSEFIVNSSVSELNASIAGEVSSEVVEVISVVNGSVTASVSLDNSSELVSPASSEIVLNSSENISNSSDVLLPSSNLTNSSNDIPQTTNLAVVDALGNVLNTDISVDGSIVAIDFINGPVESMSLVDVVNGSLPRVDSVPMTMSAPEGSWAQIYAIDPTNTTFDYGVVEVVAKGKTLFKCKDWNFDARSCFGEWVKVADDMVPGNTYYLEIDALDPAFGEIVATSAQHLDSNYLFVSDIFSSIESVDGVWSGPVRAGEFVRVEFEHDLENGNVIDFLARDNGTVSFVEVYVANTSILVGRSGVAGIPELQYVTVSGLSEPTNLFDLKVVKLVVDVDDSNCEEADCNANTHYENALDGFLEFDFIHDAAISSLGADGLIVYTMSATNTPRYRIWNNSGTAFGAELTASVDPGAQASWSRVVSNHQYDQSILVMLDESTNTSAQVWNGSAWGNFQALADDSPNTAQRSFDVAVEDISGDALVVFDGESGVDTTIYFRSWNGSVWGSENTLTHGINSAVRWVKTVARPRSDSIMVMGHTSGNDLFAQLWNGSSFVQSTQINVSGSLGTATQPVFDFVWMGLSGDGLLVYRSSGAPTAWSYRIFNSTSASWSSEASFFSLDSGAGTGIRLCEDSNSNYVGAVTQDGTSDANFRVWNGTAVETSPAPPSEDGDAEANSAAAVNVECAFLKNGTALFTYVPNPTASEVGVRTCSYNKSAWSNSSLADCPFSGTISTAAVAIENTEIYSNPVSNEVMLLAFNIDEDLDASRWNGSAWTNVTTVETSLDCLNGVAQCASFSWDFYDPSPDLTIISPSNNSNFSLSSNVNVSVNGSDNVNLSSVNVSVVAPNGSSYVLSMSRYSGNAQSGAYSVNFSTTFSTGRYNFTVFTSDDGTHSNSKSVSGYFNILSNVPPSVSGGEFVPLEAFVNTFTCLSVNVSDSSGVSNVSAVIDVPVGADVIVNLSDGYSCNSVPNDGEYSALYNVTQEGVHTWTSVNATDSLGSSVSSPMSLSVEGIVGLPASADNLHPVSSAFNDGTLIDSSFLLRSDDVRAEQSVLIGSTTFMYFNLSPSLTIPVNDTNVTIEQSYSGLLAPTITLQVLNNSVWQTVCSLTASTSDAVNVCDLDTFVNNNLSFVNNLQLRTNMSGITVLTTQMVDEVFISVKNSSANVTAPNISDVIAIAGNVSANISWKTNESTNASVKYGVTLDLPIFVGNSSLDSVHLFNLSSLVNGTVYYYNVTSCNVSGNCATSGPFNFTTKTESSFNIFDVNNNSLMSFIEVYKLNGSLEANVSNDSSGFISPGIKDVRMIPSSGPIREINFTNLTLTGGDIMFGYDDAPDNTVPDPKFAVSGFGNVFAINPENLNFDKGSFAINTTSRMIVKCANWDFDGRSCPGDNWTVIRSGSPGELVVINFTSSDPGYGEINATAAEHLDENQTFVSDIFAQVNETDGVWSESIPENHSVRVVFQANLTNGSVIDFLARDNGTVSFVEVYVANTSILVGRSGIASPVEPQFVELSNMPNETDTFDLRVVKHLHNLTLDSCPGDPECNASSITENNLTGFIEFDFIHDEAVSALGASGLISYSESAVSASRYRLWNNTATSFGAELTNTVTTNSSADWIVVHANHERDTTVMMILDQGSNTSAQVWNGSAWGNFQQLASQTPSTAQRSIDFSIEDISGDILFVYENVSAADNILAFRTFNGTAYGAEGAITHNLGSPVRWVKAVPRSGTDNVMVMGHTTANDLFAILWNGTSFVTSTLVNASGALGAVTQQVFDFEWGGVNGDGFLSYRTSGAPSTISYRNFSSATNTWSAEATFFTLDSGALTALRLCADPQSNYIGAVTQDGTSDANFWIWNGTALETSPARPAEDPDSEATPAGGVNLDCAWETQSDIARFIYVANPASDQASVRTCTYNKTAWSNSSLAACPLSPVISASTESIENLDWYRNPVTNEFMLMVQNLGEDLDTARWNGTNYTNITTLETTLACANGATQCVMFDWDRFDPNPNISIVVPANDTNFSQSSVVNISANASDNVNVSFVNVSVVLPNGTVNTNLMVLVSGSSSSGIYELNFSNTSALGRYNFTVFANDSSTHNNTNLTSGFFNIVAATVANLTVNKSDLVDPVIRGTTVNYTISINNTGDGTAFNVTVVDTYPVNVSFVSSEPAPTVGNNTFVIGNLLSNASFVVNISLTVSSAISNGTVLIDAVNVTFNQTNGTSSSVNDTEGTTVIGFPNINLRKVGMPNPVENGTTLMYQITISNNGDEIAYNITVVDTYPDNVSFINSSPSPSSGNDTFSIGNLLPAGSTTINITVNVSSTAPNGSVLNNSFNVTFANFSGVNLTLTNSTNTTVGVDETAPNVTIISPTVFTYLLNESVNITANVTDDTDSVDQVVFNISYPDGTIQVFGSSVSGTLYNLTFLNLTQRGNYTVRVIANDSNNNINSSETVNFSRVSFNVIDIVNSSNGFLNYTVGVLNNISGVLNLSINVSDKRIKQINVTLHNESSPFSILRVDDESNETLFVEYAVDTSDFNFTNASFTATSVGDGSLYTCKNYNLSAQDCTGGNWSVLLDISFGVNYTVNLTPGDPGFLETSAAADVDVAPINFTTFVIGFVDVNESDISFRIMNTNGTVIVNTVDVDTTADNDSRVSVAVKNTTHFVISWIDGPNDDLNYQIFNFSGQNETNVTTIDPDIGLNTDVDVAEIGDRFSVCYANDQDNNADFQEYFNNGTQAVGETAVDVNIAPGAPLQNLVSCYAINGSRWTYFYFDDADNDVSFAILDQAGAIVTGPTDIDAAVGENAQVAVTTINRNESAFVFFDDADSDITITVIDAAGTVVLANTDIDTDAGTVSRVGIATVWRNDTNTTDLFVPVWYDNTSNVIRAAVYERNGTEVTAPFVVSSQPDATFRLLEATGRDPTTNNSLCPGTFVVAFSNSSGMGQFLGFFVNGSSWDGTCASTLNVTKSDTPDPVVKGTQLNYTILVNNTGFLTAFNVTVVESYPSGIIFDSSSPVPSSSNNTWIFANLSPGNSTEINITVNVSSSVSNGSILNNSVTVTSNNSAGTSATVVETENTTVLGFPVIAIAVVDSPDPVLNGSTLTKTINISNIGDDIAFNITLVEIYPVNVTFNGSVPAPDVGNNTWSLGNLSPNASVVVIVTLNVSGTMTSGVLNNTVNVTFSNSSGQNITGVNSSLTTVTVFVPPVPSRGSGGGGGGGGPGALICPGYCRDARYSNVGICSSEACQVAHEELPAPQAPTYSGIKPKIVPEVEVPLDLVEAVEGEKLAEGVELQTDDSEDFIFKVVLSASTILLAILIGLFFGHSKRNQETELEKIEKYMVKHFRKLEKPSSKNRAAIVKSPVKRSKKAERIKKKPKKPAYSYSVVANKMFIDETEGSDKSPKKQDEESTAVDKVSKVEEVQLSEVLPQLSEKTLSSQKSVDSPADLTGAMSKLEEFVHKEIKTISEVKGDSIRSDGEKTRIVPKLPESLGK